MSREILVVAQNNKAEALRVAIGLVLLSDVVKVVVLGELPDTPAISEQREMLEFAEVPCEMLPAGAGGVQALASDVAHANMVYVL